MTIGVNNRNDAVGSDATAVYPYGFKIFAASDLQVTVRDSTNVETTLAYPTQYSVSNVGNKNGGNVSLSSVGGAWQNADGTLKTGYAITVRRVRPLTQASDIRNQGGFFADVHEDTFDHLVMIDQQQQDEVDRSFKLPTTEDGTTANTTLPAATSRANKYFKFDSSGNPSVADASSASGTSVTATGSTTARMLADRFAEIYNVKDYGAIGDGVTNDTAAIAAAVSALNAGGGGVLFFPKGTYKVVGKTDHTVLFALTSLSKGFALLGFGVTIADSTAYAGIEYGYLFSFTGVKNIFVRTPKITSANNMPNLRGIKAFQFAQGCDGIDVQWEQDGGLSGVEFYRAYNDPEADRCQNYYLRGKVSNVFYPCTGQYSGDHGEVWLDTLNCGRNFFYYGARHVRIRNRQKNQQSTANLSVMNGFGCEDFDISIRNRESTDGAAAAPLLGIYWVDTTAGSHKNLRVNVDILNPPADPFGCTIEFSKLDGAGNADVANRGHSLDGLVVSGISEQTAGRNHFNTTLGAFNAAEAVRGVVVRDFIGKGASINDNWACLVPAISGRMVFDNVHYRDTNIVVPNLAVGRVIFQNCTAPNFSATAADTDLQDLINCSITSGAQQSIIGKSFINSPFTSGGVSIPRTGEFVTRAFNAANFTANGAMTWTVAAGDVTTDEYTVNGKMMTYNFDIRASSVGGVAASNLLISIPSGFTAAKTTSTRLAVALDNSVTRADAFAQVTAGQTQIAIFRDVAENTWAGAADTTQVRGSITFEVQ